MTRRTPRGESSMCLTAYQSMHNPELRSEDERGCMDLPCFLLSLDDRTLAYHELRQDPAFPYLKPEAYADYIDRSLAAGRAAAAPYSGRDPSELAEYLGVRIVYREALLEIGGQSVHAEYDAGTRTIILCSHSMLRMQAVLDDLQRAGPINDPAIRALCAERPPDADADYDPLLAEAILSTARQKDRSESGLASGGRSAVSPPDGSFIDPANVRKPTTALALHIAHELFHHIEETLIGRTDEQLPVVTAGRVGNLKWGVRRVQRCREIAAHSFAKALTGLPFMPNALDWLARFVRQEPELDEIDDLVREMSL